MPWAKGNTLGGRTKGSKNKSSGLVARLIKDKFPGWNPIVAMAEISQDATQDMAIRVICLKDVASYLYPKQKAVEVTGEIRHVNSQSTYSESVRFLEQAGIDVSDLHDDDESTALIEYDS